MNQYFLAIDIGASSGRHIVGWMENGKLETKEVYRFPNGVKKQGDRLVWDVLSLFDEVKRGIAKTFAEFPNVESLSIDTWGVDGVLMAGDKEILPVYAYRDTMPEWVFDGVHEKVPFAELYAHTGCQFQTFTTVYKLYREMREGRLDEATDFLMIPEYLMYKLTGVRAHEYTNHTTTGLISAKTGEYDEELVERIGLPKKLFPRLTKTGTLLGNLLPEIAKEVGGNTKVRLCATHDTGSAVEAIDMEENTPYISSGTWSLLGVKTDKPITDEGSRAANYSNEGGVGYNRYQKNIMGLWIVQCLRRDLCPDKSYGTIAEEAAASHGACPEIDVNDRCFLSPENMKVAIDEYLLSHGLPALKSESEYFDLAYRSLAKSYRIALDELERNTGKTYDALYIVGGGAMNTYLNDLTAKYTAKNVKPLPIEATAIGNMRVQMKFAD